MGVLNLYVFLKFFAKLRWYKEQDESEKSNHRKFTARIHGMILLFMP
jgi:hypothetical protein